MSASTLHRRSRFALAAGLAFAALGGTASSALAAGSVYTQTNDPAGNAVQRFDRAADGELVARGTFSTGGVGLAGLGGRQGAVELSDDEAFVYAINAGSSSVTAFRVTEGGLEAVDQVASGGSTPVSVDEQDGRVYVLNSGGTPNVTGFTVGSDGRLTAIPGGSRDLPGAQGAAQVSVAPDGSALVVSERLSNRLETLALDESGVPGAPVIVASSGTTPFGFAFGRRSQIIVSEAGSASVSSYKLRASGGLSTITGSLSLGLGGICWVAVPPNGRFAYTGNVSGSISVLRVATDGDLSSLDTVALTPTPRDLDFSRNGRYLYAISPGNATTGGAITGYRVATDGSLTEVTQVPAAAGITGTAAS